MWVLKASGIDVHQLDKTLDSLRITPAMNAAGKVIIVSHIGGNDSAILVWEKKPSF